MIIFNKSKFNIFLIQNFIYLLKINLLYYAQYNFHIKTNLRICIYLRIMQALVHQLHLYHHLLFLNYLHAKASDSGVQMLGQFFGKCREFGVKIVFGFYKVCAFCIPSKSAFPIKQGSTRDTKAFVNFVNKHFIIHIQILNSIVIFHFRHIFSLNKHQGYSH